VAGITWGINGHPFVSYGGVSLAGQVDLVKQMGLNSYRVDIYNSSQSSMKTLSTLIAELVQHPFCKFSAYGFAPMGRL
jgi:hypothetical protein